MNHEIKEAIHHLVAGDPGMYTLTLKRAGIVMDKAELMTALRLMYGNMPDSAIETMSNIAFEIVNDDRATTCESLGY